MVKKESKIQIEQYEHSGKERANNPHVGLVTPASDPDRGEKKTYQYDPHLDPQLQWAGKTEHSSFDVPTVSLHVHERIDPNSIIKSVKKVHKARPRQLSLFETNEKPLTGNVESGGKKNIAMWMLDSDYDNRSLFPAQVFFPMAGAGDGWDKLAKNLKAEIDEEKIESFKGTLSLEFEPTNCVAVKIIDDRGIESLRVINL